MYKSLLAASLTAIVAYLFASSSLLSDSLLQLSVDFKSKRAYTTMSESATSVSRTVTKKVFAVEQNEVRVWSSVVSKYLALIVCGLQGDGARVRRSIGSMSLRNLTPFLMLDHFHVGKGAVCLNYSSTGIWLISGAGIPGSPPSRTSDCNLHARGRKPA